MSADKHPVAEFFLRTEPLAAIYSGLPHRLEEARAAGRSRRAAPRADEIVGAFDRGQEGHRRMELAASKGLEALQAEADRLISGFGGAQGELPSYVDLLGILLLFRRLGGWESLVAFVDRASAAVRIESVPFGHLRPVAQQHGMALNRLGRSEEAETVLKASLTKHGLDAETLGILGRVYKDRWLRSRGHPEAEVHLLLAVETYANGLVTNIGELYPAINCLTLGRIAGVNHRVLEPLESHTQSLLMERLRDDGADFFDYAAGFELYLGAGDYTSAKVMLNGALERVREAWEPETAAHTLRMIMDSEHATAAYRLLRRFHEALTRAAKRLERDRGWLLWPKRL